jgi:hypothetical protein
MSNDPARRTEWLGDRLTTMPGPNYYHRQADLCLEMALSASQGKERRRLLVIANEYRDLAARVEMLQTSIVAEQCPYQLLAT